MVGKWEDCYVDGAFEVHGCGCLIAHTKPLRSSYCNHHLDVLVLEQNMAEEKIIDEFEEMNRPPHETPKT